MSAVNWRYNKDRSYNFVKALEDYHPEELEQDMMLQLAVFQIKSASLLIDQIMSDKEHKELYSEEE